MRFDLQDAHGPEQDSIVENRSFHAEAAEAHFPMEKAARTHSVLVLRMPRGGTGLPSAGLSLSTGNTLQLQRDSHIRARSIETPRPQTLFDTATHHLPASRTLDAARRMP